MHGFVDGVCQQVVVNRIAVRRFLEHLRQVDGAEVAALVGEQGLLAARVGALDLALGGDHVVSVQAVEEDDAGFAVGPGCLDDGVEDFLRVEGADCFAGFRVDQIVIAPAGSRLHEFLGQADGDVEVVDVVIVLLALDELHDVRMVDAQDAHVGAASGAALLDGFGGGVEDLHKTDRAAGNAACGTDGRAFLAQAGERKACAAAGFVDERRILDGVKNLFHAVADGQDKAGGELSERTPRVHERGGVGQELEAGHELEEVIAERGGIRIFIEVLIGACYGV